MKLKTSFFNSAVLKKDLTRFAPAWGVYGIMTLLYVILLYNDGFYSYEIAFSMMGIVNLFYAGLCGVLLFGDLFNSRHCNALHAMPMRREGWFFTHLAAGTLFCLIPNLAGTLVAMLLMKGGESVALLWLAVSVLEYIFFFGAAVLAAVCAGNRLGAVAIYGLINFLSVLIAWLVETFYAPVLPGVVMDTSGFRWFSPPVQFSLGRFVEATFPGKGMVRLVKVFGADWAYAGILTAVGIAFMALALLVYRKRKLETAGDFISLKPISPVFLVLYTLFVGAMFYLVKELFGTGGSYAFLVIGMAVGFFTGKMLLERRVKVFGGKTWLKFAVLLAVFFATIFAAWIDPFGVVRYVPKAEQVKSVTIYPYEKNNTVSYTADYYYYQRGGLTLTEKADIEEIVKIHDECVENRYEEVDNAVAITISYKLKTGATVSRVYHLQASSEAGERIKPLFSRSEYILGTSDLKDFLTRAVYMEYYSYNADDMLVIKGAQAATGELVSDRGMVYSYKGSLVDYELPTGLIEAIAKDCEEGTMAQIWEYHNGTKEPIGSLSVQLLAEDGSTDYMDITIYNDSKHTKDYMKSMLKK